MKPEKFVRAIRSELIDDLVNQYADLFTSNDLNDFKDKEMHSLARLWKMADSDTRDLLKLFIRLGSQNSISSFLGILDNVSKLKIPHQDLQLNEIDGTILNGDLLDIFWEQEEEAGNVNQ